MEEAYSPDLGFLEWTMAIATEKYHATGMKDGLQGEVWLMEEF